MINDIISISIIPVITKVKLKTWVPYSIRYPIPALLTKNSPIITPINDIEILSFKLEIIVSLLCGSTNLVNNWYLVALKDLNSFILYGSVLINPL